MKSGRKKSGLIASGLTASCLWQHFSSIQETTIGMRHPGTKIFLLEDNPLYQTLMVKQLEDSSPDVRVFGTGESFLLAIAESVPDLVILDYNLEGIMTGYDVLKELKKLPCPPPVIFFSANLEITVTSAILKLGIAQYIEKNIFTFPRLKECVELELSGRLTGRPVQPITDR